MSITSALYSATSGLTAQSKALASISSNIANSSTTGYKSTGTNFQSFINQTSAVDEQVGGVIAYNYRNIAAQGEIQSSTTTTNLAINGSGFFAVSDDSSDGDIVYTRNGSFSTDSDGNLVNSEGNYLYGWSLDSTGSIAANNRNSIDSLEAINTTTVKGTPKATSSLELDANLPSDAATGDTFTSDVEVFDALGNSHSIALTWTKTGDNAWELDAADPTLSSDSGTTTGTISGFPVTIAFNEDGSLASSSASSFSIADWTTGAGDSTISLDLGTADGTDGLTQYASGEDEPEIGDFAFDQDGYEPGTLTGTTIDENGIVSATFDNGETRAVYQIPIVTFANPDGLDSETGSVFTQTAASGQYQLHTAGDGSAGEVKSSALESSTVEMTDEFSRMIIAQQAYTAASKVVTTADEMLTTLISMKR